MDQKTIAAGTLPNDIARCHDEKCGAREHCQRWLQREHGGQRVVHAETLKPNWIRLEDACEAKI